MQSRTRIGTRLSQRCHFATEKNHRSHDRLFVGDKLLRFMRHGHVRRMGTVELFGFDVLLRHQFVQNWDRGLCARGQHFGFAGRLADKARDKLHLRAARDGADCDVLQFDEGRSHDQDARDEGRHEAVFGRYAVESHPVLGTQKISRKFIIEL